MTTYSGIFDDVVTWTNRPKLINETAMAIRQAVRSAHRAGVFYRDLVTVPIVGVSTANAIQQIDLSAVAPNYRQLATLSPTGTDIYFSPVSIRDLLDHDGYPRTNVMYTVGTNLMVRPAAAYSDYTLIYNASPITSPIENLTSWIAVLHQDLIVLWAAATILTLVGEQEVKTRVEGLAKLAFDDLIADQLDAVGA